MTILATTLFMSSAAPNGRAEEAASPRLAMRARGNVPDTPARGPSAASDLDRTGRSNWLGSSRLEGAELARGESPAPRWAWCTLGVMSLAILGLFSFGWHEGHVPDGSGLLVQHELRPTEPSCPTDKPTAAAAPAPRHGVDAPKLSGGDAPPPTAMRPSHSVCIGICAGGDVWAVACGV